MKEKFLSFMRSRYGRDYLNNFLLGVFYLVLIFNLFYKKAILTRLCLFLAIIILFRTFSKNFANRNAENQKFLELTKPVRKFIKSNRRKFKDRKIYKYIRCPKCKLEMRVPKNKGKVLIHCKSCGKDFAIRT